MFEPLTVADVLLRVALIALWVGGFLALLWLLAAAFVAWVDSRGW